jgi:hypothetical protein
MAKPRVFISSTYYDLKHIRASLENFLESLGFEPILSEKGDIAYTPEAPLDESCYREAEHADIFVLIIGRRYGSAASGEAEEPDGTFFQRYNSITRMEYESAVRNGVPTYILLERSVDTEYQTYLLNKDREDVKYAHAQSVNIFTLIEEIRSTHKGNPIQTFDGYADIEEWLREQWSGYFRELLQRNTSQQQIASLTSQVAELRQVSETLRSYMETVVKRVSPDDSDELIKAQEDRLREAEMETALETNPWVGHLTRRNFAIGDIASALRAAQSFESFGAELAAASGQDLRKFEDYVDGTLRESAPARIDMNAARSLLGLPPLEEPPPKPQPSKKRARSKAKS